VKLSRLARSLEPLIFYSEHGVQQIGALQGGRLGLGEIRSGHNITSAPSSCGNWMSFRGLLSPRFFANVDSGIDSILIVMD